MTGTTVSFHGPFRKTRHLEPMEWFASLNVSHFKAQQFVDTDEAKRLRAVDRERPNSRGKWTHMFFNGVRSRVLGQWLVAAAI